MVERRLAHIFGTKFFKEMGFVQSNTKSNKFFAFRTNLNKANDQMFQLIPKNLFGPQSQFFSQKNSTVTQNFIWDEVLSLCKSIEKNNTKIQWKPPVRQKDGQTLLYRTIRATARGPKRISITTYFLKKATISFKVNTFRNGEAVGSFFSKMQKVNVDLNVSLNMICLTDTNNWPLFQWVYSTAD